MGSMGLPMPGLRASHLVCSRDVLRRAVLQCQRPRIRSCYIRKCQASAERPSDDVAPVLRSIDLLDNLLKGQDERGDGGGGPAGATSQQGPVTTSNLKDRSLASSDGLDGRANQVSSSQMSLTAVTPAFEELKGMAEEKLRKYLSNPELTGLGKNPDALPKVKPQLAYYILLVNIVIYGAGLVAGWLEGGDVSEDYFLSLAKVNSEIELGQYYRLVTANFLHDSFMHLAASCYALYTLAPEVEAVLGYNIFAAVYLLAGLAGSTACFVFTDSITVGASGSLFGLIGALVAYLWKNQHIQQSREQLVSIASIIIFNLILGSWEETSIDNLGHIAGIVTGAYLGWGLAPSLLPDPVQPGDVRDAQPADSSLPANTAGAPGDVPPTVKPMQLVDAGNPLARWAGYLSFTATLCLTVAGTVISRTGELPAPVWWIPAL